MGHRIWTTVFLAFLFGIVASITFQATNMAFDKTRKFTNPRRSLVAENAQEASSSQAASSLTTSEQEVATAQSASTSKLEAMDSQETMQKLDGPQTNEVGSVAQVAKEAMPSVVAITTVSLQEYVSFWGRSQNYASTGTGSGIIVGENDDELLIATNYHVVDNATDLTVCFIGNDVVSAQKEIVKTASGKTGLNLSGSVEAKIKGEDEDNDLAVISVKKADIPEETLEQIKIAQIGSSDDLCVGEQVVAIGNALGYGQTVTSGWISALERPVTLSNGNVVNLLQTDAAINVGNSGGALLNMKGQLIAINCAKYNSSTVEGTGYAIPVSFALPILEELMIKETREKVTDPSQMGTLDLNVANVSSEVQWLYGIPDGAFITDVMQGGRAEAAGIVSGDVITRLDGHKITDCETLSEWLQYYKAGEMVKVTVARSSLGRYYEKEFTVDLSSS